MKDRELTLEDAVQVRFLLEKFLEQKVITYSKVMALSNVLGELVVERFGIEKSSTVKKCASCKEVLLKQHEKEYGICMVCLSQRMN